MTGYAFIILNVKKCSRKVFAREVRNVSHIYHALRLDSPCKPTPLSARLEMRKGGLYTSQAFQVAKHIVSNKDVISELWC